MGRYPAAHTDKLFAVECVTCDYKYANTDKPALASQIARYHARNYHHQVLMHRTTVYDFRAGDHEPGAEISRATLSDRVSKSNQET